MKKIMNSLQRSFVILILVFITYSIDAQSPGEPPGGAAGTSNNSGNSQSAPIGGGIFILLGLGAAYGGWKLYQRRKEQLEE